MKKLLAALTAVLLIWSLAACRAETAPDPEPPTPPTQEEPDEPGGDAPVETPDEPDDETPDDEPASETPDGGVQVTAAEEQGTVEDTVSYRIARPEVSTGDAAVDQILNDYYARISGEIEDLCYGEVYEQALQDLQLYHVDADFSVERNDGGVLSIYRTVTVQNLQTGDVQTTARAETFDLQSGGLLTAADFFDADEADWTGRLVDGVRRIIGEDPYHDRSYDPQWSDLCASAFQRENFYVTDDAFVVFYQAGDLGPEAQTVFEIPWSSLADLTA